MLGLSSRLAWWVAGGTVLSAVLVALNVFSELNDPEATLLELALDAIEIVLMVTGVCGVGLLLDRMRMESRERTALAGNLALARSEGEGWRTRVQGQLAGISAEIDRQFDDWSLTPAEKDISRLMLKGLSHKEIASLRNTGEATVRQQARSIYQKSSLPGKAAFSAFFLEDLLAPALPTEPNHGINQQPATSRETAAMNARQ